jgi:hypothetical protein
VGGPPTANAASMALENARLHRELETLSRQRDILKKSIGHLKPGPVEFYEVITKMKIDSTIPLKFYWSHGVRASRASLSAPALHHSDRGVQYAAQDFRKLLKTHDVLPMSRKICCYDNAVCFSWL